ncbi:unnamed protein product [Ceutorhynchus assimilis]|uniref:TIL domain-containing protein n=1 Tax=Ceutorhynchus assimilis TaxID=467358 RepID=A0A9N9QRV0_9CUCU|nr:unnamed protein product [Ceutorhynchus assimilis]
MNKLFVVFLVVVIAGLLVGVLAEPAPPCECHCSGEDRACRGINDCINKCDSEGCTQQVIWACYCREGYCLNEDDVCVPICYD